MRARRTGTQEGRLEFLETLNRMLDDLVKRRTLDLVSANERLVQEIVTRREAEQELERSRDDLRSLTEHLHRAQEEERMRIARELHDQVGQVLSALKIDASCLAVSPIDVDQLRRRAGEMSRHIDSAIRCVRTACSDLRVPVLEDFGLAAAIRYHLERIQERTGLRCKAHLDSDLPHLDRTLALLLYRVFQEAVSNVVRHAHARSLSVALRRQEDQIALLVRDDGNGIRGKAGAQTGSFGILGIRERVRFWGGLSTFRSVAGKGTAVVVRMPIVRGEPTEGTPPPVPDSGRRCRPRPRRAMRRAT